MSLAFIVCYVIAMPVVSAADAGGEKWTYLLDRDLSHFDTWLGTPHASVEGLPEGTPQSSNIRDGTPLGLNNDPTQVFSVIEKDDDLLLRISGEIYGSLITKEPYDDYHLSLWKKWGDKKWAPRLQMPKNSGILYHSHGEHGAAANAWMASFEFQGMTGNKGDLITVAGSGAAYVRGRMEDAGNRRWVRYDSSSEEHFRVRGRAMGDSYPEKPHGEWNKLDLYTFGSTSVHVVNGKVVLVVEDAIKSDGTPLNKGQIQFQSEGAECFFKEIKISPFVGLPPEIEEQIKLGFKTCNLPGKSSKTSRDFVLRYFFPNWSL